MSNKLISEKVAAQLSSLSTSWFQKRRVHRDGPPYYKIGGAVRYDIDELQAWFRKQSEGHTLPEARDQ